MGLIDLFIKKPVISIAICIVVILAGLGAYFTMPLRQFPVFPPSIISVSTGYPGANPAVVQGFVTLPIEEALADINGIDYITAQNTQGASDIQIHLKSGVDINKILTQVNAEVSSVKWRLPSEINDPIISKSVSSSPSIFLAVTTSKGISLEQASAYINHVIVPELRAVPGVQKMRVRGAREYAMRIWLNPDLMAAYGVTPKEVRDALTREHLQAAVGKLKSNMQEYSLSLDSSLSKPKDFDNIVIAQNQGKIIRLKDVGYASFGAQNQNSSVIVNGKRGMLIYVMNQPDANDIKTVNSIIKDLPTIQAKLPPSIHLSVLWNPTKFSEASIHEVKKTILEAIILIIIVTFLFLGEFTAMLIPIVTIPLSLLGACILMSLVGFSVNTMTLLAIVLAIGLVVDDAIVVLENVHRHIMEGVKPVKAAMVGTHEIFSVIVAMTLVVAIVFIPVGLTSGITGILFREFAFTLSFTVILSGIFALFVSPMMCAYLLKKGHSRYAGWVNQFFDKFSAGYQAVLEILFKVNALIVLLVIAMLALCFFMFKVIPSELMPQENQGVVLGVGGAPSAANNNYMLKYGQEVANIYKNLPGMSQYGIIAGDSPPFNNMVSFAILKDGQSAPDEEKVIEELRPRFSAIPGLNIFPMNRPLLADVTGLTAPVSFVVQTTGSYEDLDKTVARLAAAAKNNPKLLNVDEDLKINRPQYTMNLDRDKAASLGISEQNVADTLNTLYAEPTIAWFSLDGFSYPVITQAINRARQNPQAVQGVQVKDAGGQLIPLSSVLSFKREVVPLVLTDFQRLHSATLTANLAPGYSLGQALNFLKQQAATVLPKTMKYDYSGESRLFENSHGEMYIIYLASLIAIYLLLIIKFNSFVDPIIILLSVPLAMAGALLAIYFNDFTLNIYTQIGLVMLLGLISKQGIMIVDFANHLQRDEDLSIREAVLKASHLRLRPILMTNAAMILGVIPLIFATGAGHESLQQIGWVIFGGLIFGSVFTLMVVPSLYKLLAKDLAPE